MKRLDCLGRDGLGMIRRPNRYEVATGLVIGCDPGTEPLSAPAVRLDARTALENVVRYALTRTPCLVSFSGGRDSSAVLAVAAHVARREGLALPVPVTLRFRGAESQESDWQEAVTHHLRLEDWERIELDDIDLVGPIAAGILRRHGVLWPANAHFHAPMLARAAHGSLLTGIDGDVLFGGWRWEPLAPQAGLATRVRRERDYAAHLIFAALPGPARRAVRCGVFRRPEWIHPTGWREVVDYLASVWQLEPRRWDARVSWWHKRRYLACGRWSLSLLAEDQEVRLVHPLLAPAFLAALARTGGRHGYPGRTEVMTQLFGDLLPPSVLSRADKATFDTAIWAGQSRAFLRGWDGTGVDESLVDVGALRREWEKPVPHFQTAALLQTAWLHADGEKAIRRIG